MFAVRRYMIDDWDKVMEIRNAQNAAHEDYIRDRTANIVASSILDENGKVIGSLSISAMDSRDEIEAYVYGDPFTVHGMFKRIEIERVNIYMLDETYACCPEWFRPHLKDIQAKRLAALATAATGAS
jgi:uncharacterized protein YciI